MAIADMQKAFGTAALCLAVGVGASILTSR